MELVTKEDWQEAQARVEAWWQGEIIDRAAVRVTAPRQGHIAEVEKDIAQEELVGWFTDPAQVVPRLERYVNTTFWGGEAFPVVFPVAVRMVAILAAYLGSPYALVAGGNTGWAEPIIENWATRPRFAYDPANDWWRMSRRLLEAAGTRAPGRYYVGVPDLNGPSEILALLRGTQRLAVDLLENPQAVEQALDEVNLAWLRYWEAANGIIHQWIGGYFYWMGIWSDRPSIDLQSDLCCLISPRIFEAIFLPRLEQQTGWVERTIYHLDGPNAIRHLDALLALPRLSGIQWVPGAGAPPMSKWIRLLRRIQASRKLLVLDCEPWEVETLLAELEPEGLLLSTQCESEEIAKELLKKVPRWTARRQWVAP
jgi:hypothetical protein